MTKKPNNTAQTAQDEAVVYCGPSIRNVIKQFSVFKGSLPSVILEQAEKQPLIYKLIVPVTTLAETRTAIATPGTPENIWYNKILIGGDE